MTEPAAALGEDTLAIYLFHGVISQQRHDVRNYTRKHLPAREFEAVVESLARRGTPLSIGDAAAALAGHGELPPYSFVVSFDDGFHNNHAVAAPILEAAGVPAVFYVTTGFIDSNLPSWIDVIEFVFESLRGGTIKVLGRSLPAGSREERIESLDWIRAAVKSRPDINPDALAHDVLGTRPFEPDPELDEKMAWDDVRALDGHPLFTVGGHSHTHKILSFLDDDELDFEVGESIRRLETELGRAPVHYSYPEGLEHCYSDRVIERLRAGGIEVCPTAVEGVNAVGADPFRLKRVWVL